MALGDFGQTAAIITIGDEVVEGRISNENAAWLGCQLIARGIWPRLVVAVPDDEDLIVRQVRLAYDSADVVIVCGGLGFTPDDITRRAVARACLEDVAVDEPFLRMFFESTPWATLELATAVSTFPKGSSPIPSQVGGVPGFVLGRIYVLPGAPTEMRSMFECLTFPRTHPDIHVRSMTCSATEDSIHAILEEFESTFHDVRLGSYADYAPEGPRVGIVLAARATAAVNRASDWLTGRIAGLR